MSRLLSAVAVLLGWVAAAAALFVFIALTTNLGRSPHASTNVAVAAVLASCIGSVMLFVKRRHPFAILAAWAPPLLAVGAFIVYQAYTSSEGYGRRSREASEARNFDAVVRDPLRKVAAQEEVYRAAHGRYVGDLDTLGVSLDNTVITFLNATATSWSARAEFTYPDTPTWLCVIAVGAAPLPPSDTHILADTTSVDPERMRPLGLSTNDVEGPPRVAATRADTTRVEGGPGGTMVCAK